jgi:hypothetical protein
VLEDLPTEYKETYHLYAANKDVLHTSSDQGYISVVSSLHAQEMNSGILPLPETGKLVRTEGQGIRFSEVLK